MNAAVQDGVAGVEEASRLMALGPELLAKIMDAGLVVAPAFGGYDGETYGLDFSSAHSLTPRDVAAASLTCHALHDAVEHAGPLLWMRAAGIAPLEDTADSHSKFFVLGGAAARCQHCLAPLPRSPAPPLLPLSRSPPTLVLSPTAAGSSGAEAHAALSILRRSTVVESKWLEAWWNFDGEPTRVDQTLAGVKVQTASMDSALFFLLHFHGIKTYSASLSIGVASMRTDSGLMQRLGGGELLISAT